MGMSYAGGLSVIQEVLETGENVHTGKADGATAQKMPSLNGHVAAVQVLLRAGADVQIADAFGTTTLARPPLAGCDLPSTRRALRCPLS